MAEETKVYILYKGDEFIDVGTLDELSERNGISKRTIRTYSTPSRKRRRPNGMLAYLYEGDDESETGLEY